MNLHRATALLFAAALLSAPAFAAVSDPAPLRCKGAVVSVLQSGSSGATLHAVAESPASPPQDNTHTDGEDYSFGSGLIWAVPFGTDSVAVTIENAQWRDVLPGEYPDSVVSQILAQPHPPAMGSRVMHMRGMAFVSLALNLLQPDESNGALRICTALDIRLSTYGCPTEPDARTLSPTFHSLARQIASNLDEATPAPPSAPEPYLIITPPFYNSSALQDFVEWKRSRGHTVTVATTGHTGTTNQQIRAYIQAAYQTWPEPPVFVLLVGDVDGSNGLPGWIEAGSYHPYIISDHRYALLEGDDYLPEVLVGRFSVDTEMELQTIVNKCVNYESLPYQPQGAWRTRMAIIGVQSSHDFYPTFNSSWPTLEWIGRQFLESGYSQVDEVPFPGGSAAQINSRVNAGLSFIAYRGFGSPQGWAYPNYDLYNMSGLSNGQMLPVVTSMVCGGGAFDSDVDPCFGEQWLRLGTPNNPKGAIGFIGPSELDTKTRWNNTLIAGFYEGVLHEGVQSLGAGMLRSKLELVREFPNNVDVMEPDAERSVGFYFTAYNLLGDPGLTFFVGPVKDLTASVPSSASLGLPSVTLSVTSDGIPLPGAWGTVMSGGELLSRGLSDSSGLITLALPQVAGTFSVTLTKPQHETVQATLSLAQQPMVIAAETLIVRDDGTHGSAGNGDGLANPGESLTLLTVARNFGSTIFAGGDLVADALDTATISADTSLPLPALAPLAQSDTLAVTVRIAAGAADGQVGRIVWSVSSVGSTWQTPIEILAPRIVIESVWTDGTEGNPPPNDTSRVALHLENIGRANLGGSTVCLRSLHPKVVVLDSLEDYPAIPAEGIQGPQGAGFQLAVGDVYPGEWIPVTLQVTGGGATTETQGVLSVGNLSETDPTHPDTYGYRAFESHDTSYAEAPHYSWFEIDPALGGPGVVLALPDQGEGYDTTRTIPLPFPFTFYGTSYNEISICSNGFVSFGRTGESYFRNYSLPAIASPDNMVCVFWDDLMLEGGGHVCTYHDAVSGRFVIEWSGMQNVYGTHPEETFELILFDTSCWRTRTGDGDLLMQYREVNNTDTWDNYATVGIQDRDRGHHLQLTYAGTFAPGFSTLRSGSAVLLTVGRPDSTAYYGYVGNIIDDDNEGGSSGNGDGVAQNGETIQLAISLLNTGDRPSSTGSGVLRSLDPMAVLLDSIVSFPSIAAGQSAATSPVRVRLAALVAHGHAANFILELAGDAMPCVITPSVAISAPALTVLAPLLDDDATPPSDGNGNGQLNPGETVAFTPQVVNFGGNRAAAVRAVLRCTSAYVVVTDSVAQIGDVLPDSLRVADDSFIVYIQPYTPNGGSPSFTIVAEDSLYNRWQARYVHVVTYPVLAAAAVRISDPPPDGNGDGKLVRGESGGIYVAVTNQGLGTATDVTVEVQCSDTLIGLLDSSAWVGTVSPSSTRETATPFRVSVAESGAEPRLARLFVTVRCADVGEIRDTLALIVGNVNLFDDYETSFNRWTFYGRGSWQVQSHRYHSPSHSYYCGDGASHQYEPSTDAYLRSPTFVFNGRGTLVYWTRFDLNDGADICRVQLQTGTTIYHLLDSYSGQISDWQVRYCPLAGLPATDEARLRFWLSADYYGQAEGWYIDDIMLFDEEVSATDEGNNLRPTTIEIASCYPNPFNDAATIEYCVSARTPVRLTLWNVEGRRVATLVDAPREPGRYRIRWQPLCASTGIYFVRLEAAGVAHVRKIMYLR